MSRLVTKQAPDFTATAVMGDGSFNEGFKLSDYRGKYVVLFFYPLVQSLTGNPQNPGGNRRVIVVSPRVGYDIRGTHQPSEPQR